MTSSLQVDNHKLRTPVVHGQKRKRPAWTNWNFELPTHKPSTPQVCSNCGTVGIPLAHYMKKRFCTFQCGKAYMKKRQNAKEGQAS
jgi:hypothetical protein